MIHTATSAALEPCRGGCRPLALAAGGCGSDSPADSYSNSADDNGSEKATNGLIGEWVAENRCEDLVRALREAGLDG